MDLLALTTEAGVWTYGMVEAISDIVSDPVNGIWKMILANILPSIIAKGYERFAELPAIDHAIIKLEK